MFVKKLEVPLFFFLLWVESLCKTNSIVPKEMEETTEEEKNYNEIPCGFPQHSLLHSIRFNFSNTSLLLFLIHFYTFPNSNTIVCTYVFTQIVSLWKFLKHAYKNLYKYKLVGTLNKTDLQMYIFLTTYFFYPWKEIVGNTPCEKILFLLYFLLQTNNINYPILLNVYIIFYSVGGDLALFFLLPLLHPFLMFIWPQVLMEWFSLAIEEN